MHGSRIPPFAVAVGFPLTDRHDDIHPVQYVFFVPLQAVGREPQEGAFERVLHRLPPLLEHLILVVVTPERNEGIGGVSPDGVDVGRGVQALQLDHVIAPPRQACLITIAW